MLKSAKNDASLRNLTDVYCVLIAEILRGKITCSYACGLAKRNQKIIIMSLWFKQFSSVFPLLSLSLDSWKETVFFTPSKVIFLEVKSVEKFNSFAFFGDFFTNKFSEKALL